MMPVFTRPRQAIIIEDGPGTGALVLIAAVLAAGAVAGFVLAHLELLAACAAVFVVVMGSIAAGMRWLASPARLRHELHPRHTARVLPAAPAQVIPGPRTHVIRAPAQHFDVHLQGGRAEMPPAAIRRAEDAQPAISRERPSGRAGA